MRCGDYGYVAYHDYIQYLLTPDETNSEFAGDIVEFWLGIFELAGIFRNTLFSDWGYIDECRRGIELSFLTFYASSRRNTTDNTKRNNTPCCYPSVDERQEISKMEAKYPRPEFITRMKPLEASPSKAEEDQKEDTSFYNSQRARNRSCITGDRSYGLQGRQTHHSQDHSRPRKTNHLFIILETNI